MTKNRGDPGQGGDTLAHGPKVQRVGKKTIPDGVMVTFRIEMVWNGVSGPPRTVAAAAVIIPLMAVETAGVIAALIRGPTALITAENTSPVRAPLTLAVAPNPRPPTESVPDAGTTSTMVVAGALISREGVRPNTYVNPTGNQVRRRPVSVTVITPAPGAAVALVSLKPGIPGSGTGAAASAAFEMGTAPGITIVIAPLGFPGEPDGSD